MNRDDNNLEFKICLGLIILMMLMVTWFYMDVKEACAAETTDGTYYPSLWEVSWGEYEDELEAAVNQCDMFWIKGVVSDEFVTYTYCFIDSSLYDNPAYVWTGTGGYSLVYTYCFTVRSEYMDCTDYKDANGTRQTLCFADKNGSACVGTNFSLISAPSGVVINQNNLSYPVFGEENSSSAFEDINCGDYAEQLADIVNACDRMYVVQYIGFDGLVRTRYCFLRPSTITNIISSGKVLSGCTYYLPYDYAVTVYEHTVQSVTTMSGTQAFYKTDDITAYMLLGATFDIDLSSILPNYNYNKYSYPAAPEPEKPDEPVVDYTPPTTQELLDALPAEAKFYTDCIILQQEHKDAWTNDIVFYCWNVPEKYEQSTYLILRWGDSLVVAVDSDGEMMTGTLIGYWDYATGSWVVDSSTKISQTRNSTYSVPKIYYCSTNLYRQVVDQYELIPDGEACLYMYTENGFLDSDPFEEDEDDDSGLWGKLKKFFRDLFLPSTGYFNMKISNLECKFSFYKAVSSTVTAFADFFTKTDFSQPPVIEVDLSVARSKYDYGTSAVALDMSWYSEYKPYVDVFLSSVMWVVFVWNTFRHLPDIINGVGSGITILAESQLNRHNLNIQ